MTRILSWNIERFGINKLNPNAWDVNGSRRAHILNTVGQTAALAGGLDAFVIIEVQTPAGFGGLIGGASGPPGLANILGALRAAYPADGWQLVPPLVISPLAGYSEGIAVFYKSTTLNFMGPLMWNGAAGVAPAAGGAGAVAYAGIWAGALPAIVSARPGGAFNQDQLAGKVRFHNAAGAVIQFPDANGRSLWMTQFLQPNGRVLSLFAVHFPPQAYRARPAFRNLATVPEIVGAPAFAGAPEDRVVLGDFNINSVNPAEANVFAHLNGNAPAAPNSPLPYVSAFVPAVPEPTAIKSVTQSSTTGPAPFYNYGTKNNNQQLLGLDNIFIHRSGAAAAPGVFVINRVVGTPAAYPVDMVTNIPAIIAGLPAGGPRARRFRTLANYGHIGGGRGASDHLGVVVELP